MIFSLTTDISCQQLLKAIEDFHLPPYADTVAKFQLSRLLGGPARECDAAQTDRKTDRRTPDENSANSGPAWLVPGPELTNFNRKPKRSCSNKLILLVFQLDRLSPTVTTYPCFVNQMLCSWF